MKQIRSDHDGTIHMLKRVHWKFFLTILLPHQKGIEGRAEKIWHSFRGRLGRRFRVKQARLIWLVTLEHGSSGENPHFHAQISGLPEDVTRQELEEACNAIAFKLGLASVQTRMYEHRPDAVSYLFKELNSYSKRFGSDVDQWPMYSPNIPDLLRRGRM